MNPFETETEFSDRTFGEIALQAEEIEGKSFYACTFSYCSLAETQFRHCRFSDCHFSDCDLSLINVEGSSFRETTFERSTVMGVNWTLASWPDFVRRAPIGFQECTLDYATFIGLTLEEIRFQQCHARDVDFTEADLAHADFRGTALPQSRFNQTDLTEANFEGATDYRIDVTCNTVTGARFSFPEAISLLYSLDIVLVE